MKLKSEHSYGLKRVVSYDSSRNHTDNLCLGYNILVPAKHKEASDFKALPWVCGCDSVGEQLIGFSDTVFQVACLSQTQNAKLQ